MESNRTHFFLFKYILLVVGVVFMLIPVISFLFPESVKISGETGEVDITTTSMCELAGLLAIFVFSVIKGKFVIVELKNQSIIIKRNDEEETITWLDVESVTQIQFVHPPLYKLKTKHNVETVWFNTESNFISVGGYTVDLSDMGKLIKKKKKELDIN